MKVKSMLWTAALLAAAVGLASCSGNSNTETGESETATETTSETSDETASASTPPSVTTSVVSLEDLDKTVASHKGKVVILDLWATY